jgi:arylsulfatase
MMNGGGSHWADQKPLSPPQTMIYRKNGQRIETLPADFYSTKNYTDSLITYIDKNRKTDKPFFAYLSFTAPHDPLHAPPGYINKYKGKFRSGWNQLRTDRLNRLKELGLVPERVSSFPKNPLVPKWQSLTEQQKTDFARDMEVYAAMVDYVDMSIGRLFDYLKKIGEYDNTLIIFFSDNGANGAPSSAYPGNADGTYLASFDNSTENRGLRNSFIDMGAGWAQAVSSPFRLYKSFTTEGGIKSPCIIKMPGKNANGGRWNHTFTHVTDIMPTILEIASAKYPQTYKGKTLAQPIGQSLIPLLEGTLKSLHAERGIGWELFEMKAYIKSDWKILRLPQPFGSGEWELFNLKTDPGEMTDLSDDHPGLKNDLLQEWQRYVEANNVFDHKGRFDAMFRKAYLKKE